MSIEQAFYEICTNAQPPKAWYVSLYKTETWYGGPEEGGWDGTTTSVVASQRFETEEAATAAYNQIHDLAQQLTEWARQEHNEQMRRECEWCEQRGIDPADHPSGEPDGPDTYEVHMEKTVGEHNYSSDPYYS